jgi:hypothetical protein
MFGEDAKVAITGTDMLGMVPLATKRTQAPIYHDRVKSNVNMTYLRKYYDNNVNIHSVVAQPFEISNLTNNIYSGALNVSRVMQTSMIVT